MIGNREIINENFGEKHLGHCKFVKNINNSSKQRVIIKENNKKIKMRKNAFNEVDKLTEKLKDPKYKSEMCKKYIEKGFCDYGNSCRFAHGKNDLLGNEKEKDDVKYKVKNCMSFHTLGYCPYGIKCNFKHSDFTSMPSEKINLVKIDDFYSVLLENYIKEKKHSLNTYKRLEFLNNICNKDCGTSRECTEEMESKIIPKQEKHKNQNTIYSSNSNEMINCNSYFYKKDSTKQIKEYYPKSKENQIKGNYDKLSNIGITSKIKGLKGKGLEHSQKNSIELNDNDKDYFNLFLEQIQNSFGNNLSANYYSNKLMSYSSSSIMKLNEDENNLPGYFGISNILKVN